MNDVDRGGESATGQLGSLNSTRIVKVSEAFRGISNEES
jgi:hypothetical protein